MTTFLLKQKIKLHIILYIKLPVLQIRLKLFKGEIVNFIHQKVQRFDMLWLDFRYIEGLVQKEIEK